MFTAPLEFFFTKLKLAGFGAVVMSFPVLAWQVYAFVAPGLWRESLARMARLQDGQIRFVALGAIVIGLLLILV